jgi:hypothetical protein
MALLPRLHEGCVRVRGDDQFFFHRPHELLALGCGADGGFGVRVLRGGGWMFGGGGGGWGEGSSGRSLVLSFHLGQCLL